MSAERWERIQRLLRTVQALEPDERAAFLDAFRGGDAELRREVGELLASAEEAEGYFAELARRIGLNAEPRIGSNAGVDPARHEGVEPSLEGRRLGAYRLLRLLGRGGMGAVYLAERADDQFEKQVAVKLLPLGVDSEEARARFLVERQLLAGLEHPKIARLLDGGVAEDGTPYFVMERVEGRPIDRYCDEERLGVRARLELFLQVCRAVQYAHQNLVVHRDLKPSNIIVDPDGGVKLLDFGIAKLLSADPGLAATLTATDRRVMTPQFAAPEQLLGGPITTATDVYALGVLLYELLTGVSPYGVRGTGPLEMQRAILEQDPVRPSGAPVRAEARGTTPEALRRQLRGDLDTILRKALRKDPTRRYQSAQQLQDDLELHLRGLPVAARPHTLGYRFRKYARRHRVEVGAATAVVLALFGGLGVALWQADVASRERDMAWSEAAKAERVTDFLVELFNAPDPGETLGDSLSAREVLDRGRRRVETELASDPAVQATLMEVMARTYISLGDFAAASELTEAALERRFRLHGPSHPEFATSLAIAGAAARWRGDLAASDSLYRRALAIQEDVLGPDHPDVGRTIHALAAVMDWKKADSVEALLRRAVRTSEGGGAVARSEAAAAMGSLALFLHQQHQPEAYEEAERLYEEAIAIHRELLGEGHPNTLVHFSNLAWMRQARGDYEGAARAHRELLDARRNVLGPRHYQVALTLNALAEAVYLQGDYESAVSLNREALSIRSELFPADHPQVLYSLHMLARSLGAAGSFGEADSLYRQGTESASRSGLESQTVARMVNDYGALLETRGLWDRAEEAYREGWRIYRSRLGEAHPFTAIAQGNVARSRAKRGDLEEAEALHRASLETLRTAWPDDHPTVAGANVNLAELLMDRGRFAEAEPLLRQGLAALEVALADGHWRVAAARSRLGRCLTALGSYEEAEALLAASHRALSGQQQAQRIQWLDVNRRLAELHEARGDAERASVYREALGPG